MRVAVYSTKRYDRSALTAAISERHDLVFLESRLDLHTAGLAAGGFRKTAMGIKIESDRCWSLSMSDDDRWPIAHV